MNSTIAGSEIEVTSTQPAVGLESVQTKRDALLETGAPS